MSYRRSYRYGQKSHTDWSAWHQTRRAAVTRTFGGIDLDVRDAFFSLSPSDVERVMDLYRASYGTAASTYARKSYRRWRSGAVNPSGKTLERLLEVVPYVLSFDQKLALYRKLRNAYRRPESVTIRISTPQDLTMVESTVARIVERARSQPLPPIVDSRLVWLATGDGVIARQLVAAYEETDGAVIAQALSSELPLLQQIYQDSDRSHRMEHIVVLPCGTVTIDFRKKKSRRWPMSSDEQSESTNLPAKREDRPAKDIFEFALQSMISPNDSQEIVLAAQREYLRLQAKKVEGEMDAVSAERELKTFIDHMREANSLSNVHFEASGDFKRASGTTRMNVKKKSRWWPF